MMESRQGKPGYKNVGQEIRGPGGQEQWSWPERRLTLANEGLWPHSWRTVGEEAMEPGSVCRRELILVTLLHKCPGDFTPVLLVSANFQGERGTSALPEGCKHSGCAWITRVSASVEGRMIHSLELTQVLLQTHCPTAR